MYVVSKCLANVLHLKIFHKNTNFCTWLLPQMSWAFGDNITANAKYLFRKALTYLSYYLPYSINMEKSLLRNCVYRRNMENMHWIYNFSISKSNFLLFDFKFKFLANTINKSYADGIAFKQWILEGLSRVKVLLL